MPTKRLFVHSVILTYLLLILAALSYTLFRVELLPRNLFFPFYGMMAPFQSYTTQHYELIAQGRVQGGIWQQIDLHQYIPAGRGEFAYRGYILTTEVRAEGSENRYKLFAEKLQKLEAKNGKVFDDVRLVQRRWPVSADGYYTLDTHELRTEDILFLLQ